MIKQVGISAILVSLCVFLLSCSGGNRLPAVSVTRPADGETIVGKRVTFRADGADEDLPQDATLGFRWTFGDGQSATGQEVQHTYDQPGRYTVSVVAVDDHEAESEPATIRISVQNAPPEPQVDVTPVAEGGGRAFRFDAGGSHDPDGQIGRYEWDFGDGQAASGEQITHEYPESGTYDVQLTVIDDNGAQATTKATVTAAPDKATGGRLWEVRVIATDDGRYLFDPPVLFIEPGDTVRWVLVRGAHTATAYAQENGQPQGIPKGAPAWDSGLLSREGDRFAFTFPVNAPPGSYPYFCANHERLGMVGLIVISSPSQLDDGFLESLPGQAKPTMETLIERAKDLSNPD